MKIIFLDINGPIVTRQWNMKLMRDKQPFVGERGDEDFCPVAMSNLEYILEEVPDARIVISSTMRLTTPTTEFNNIFWNKVVGKTPHLGTQRFLEIRAWLEKHPKVKDFVIIDDDCNMGCYKKHFVQVNDKHGLMLEDAEEALDILGVERRKLGISYNLVPSDFDFGAFGAMDRMEKEPGKTLRL